MGREGGERRLSRGRAKVTNVGQISQPNCVFRLWDIDRTKWVSSSSRPKSASVPEPFSSQELGLSRGAVRVKRWSHGFHLFAEKKKSAAAPRHFSLGKIFRLWLITECLVKIGQVWYLAALEKLAACLLYASVSVLLKRTLLSLGSGEPGFGVGNLIAVSAAEESN